MSLALGVGAAAAGMSLVPVSAAQAATTYTVSNNLDSGPGSLRYAVAQANVDATPDTIVFDPTVTGAIPIVDGPINITESVTIAGPGAGLVTLDGEDDNRVFVVDMGRDEQATVISGLTVTGGSPAPTVALITARVGRSTPSTATSPCRTWP